MRTQYAKIKQDQGKIYTDITTSTSQCILLLSGTMLINETLHLFLINKLYKIFTFTMTAYISVYSKSYKIYTNKKKIKIIIKGKKKYTKAAKEDASYPQVLAKLLCFE